MKKLIVLAFIIFFTLGSFAQDQNSNSDYATPKRKVELLLNLEARFFHIDFKEFEPVLGSYNVDRMSGIVGLTTFQAGANIKRYYVGLNYAFSIGEDVENDTMDVQFNVMLYGLNFGYQLINSKRWTIKPMSSLTWDRYRIMNYDKSKKIPIETYLIDRNLDINFNQLTGFVGLDLAFKIYKGNKEFSDYWAFAIGAYGGYRFQMFNKPVIYSTENRLTSDSKIRTDHYSFGAYFSFHIY